MVLATVSGLAESSGGHKLAHLAVTASECCALDVGVVLAPPGATHQQYVELLQQCERLLVGAKEAPLLPARVHRLHSTRAVAASSVTLCHLDLPQGSDSEPSFRAACLALQQLVIQQGT